MNNCINCVRLSPEDTNFYSLRKRAFTGGTVARRAENDRRCSMCSHSTTIDRVRLSKARQLGDFERTDTYPNGRVMHIVVRINGSHYAIDCERTVPRAMRCRSFR